MLSCVLEVTSSELVVVLKSFSSLPVVVDIGEGVSVTVVKNDENGIKVANTTANETVLFGA